MSTGLIVVLVVLVVLAIVLWSGSGLLGAWLDKRYQERFHRALIIKYPRGSLARGEKSVEVPWDKEAVFWGIVAGAYFLAIILIGYRKPPVLVDIDPIIWKAAR